jgi:DNA-binding transcriptional LysR family regulator
MYRNLDIGLLRTLTVVVSSGGFRNAARELHLTQPAVSQQIQRLERLVDAPVFARKRPRPELTRVGEELLAYAKRIVEMNDDAVSRLVSGKLRTRLTVGLSEQFVEGMPTLLGALQSTLPDMRVDVQLGSSDELARRVARADVDMALGMQVTRTLVDHPIGRVRLGWYGRSAGTDPLPLALFTEPCTLRRRTFDSLQAAGRSWNIAFEATSLLAIRSTVAAGTAVTCLVETPGRWDLPPVDHAELPPPEPIDVNLTVCPGLEKDLVRVALAASRETLDTLKDAR